MRIDKFLWCTRLCKTRALAVEEIKKGRIEIKDEAVKASRIVKPGEELVFRRHGYFQSFQILALPKNRVGAKDVPTLILETTPPEELEKREMISLARALTRPAGDGRPTKRDRRRLDELQG